MRALLATVAFFALAGTAQAATIPVPAGGNLTTAYNQAQPGDMLELACGSYGTWETPAGSKQVTVRSVTPLCARLTSLSTRASNITFDGLDLNAGGVKISGPVFYSDGNTRNVTVRNGRIGNVVDQMGALLAGDDDATPQNTVIDNVEFWQVRVVAGDVHSECIYSQQAGLTVKNSRFGGQCGATGAIFLTRGTWWNPPQPKYGGWKFLNNTFDRQIADHGGIIFSAACEPSPIVCNNAEIRGNTFAPQSIPRTTFSGGTFTNSVESCNSPQVSLPGIAHETCGAPTPTPSPSPTATPTPSPSPTPSPTPTATPSPTPSPSYNPTCRPDCDEQIAQLEADATAHAATLVAMTAGRDNWKARALRVGKWRDRWKARALKTEHTVENLPKIRQLVAQLTVALAERTGR